MMPLQIPGNVKELQMVDDHNCYSTETYEHTVEAL